MNFTREPIIETIITSKEGCKLVVRNSKAAGQEEYFVDALEVVSFGAAFFFRSLERPKSFLVPVTDYEVLEVRDTKVMVKHVAIERSIKIGGGREGNIKSGREGTEKKEEAPSEMAPKERSEKKRERRRGRRRRGKEEKPEESVDPRADAEESSSSVELQGAEVPLEESGSESVEASPKESSPKRKRREKRFTGMSALLPPPTTLISDNIDKYKELCNVSDEGEEKPKERRTRRRHQERSEGLVEGSDSVAEVTLHGEEESVHEGPSFGQEELIGEKTGEPSTEIFPKPPITNDQESPDFSFPSSWNSFAASSEEQDGLVATEQVGAVEASYSSEAEPQEIKMAVKEQSHRVDDNGEAVNIEQGVDANPSNDSDT